jgi:hypothetical protein
MRAPTRILEILRDFLEVHRLVSELATRHRNDGLHFEELAGLIEDDEGSVLFRLKERTHALFRAPRGEARDPTHREALFDLAVGSLFHEAMKLRENLYQREIYGPRVRALHTDAEEESKALFDEFEKMLGSVEARVAEGVHELEVLVRQTADQLRLLIAQPPDDGAIRFMTERPDEVERVFGVSLEDQLEGMCGSVANGLERAGRSYLASGFFASAANCFERALQHDGTDGEIAALRDYARGMEAYVGRQYATSVVLLARWVGAGEADPTLARLARDAIASIVQLAEGDERTRVSREASELLVRLGAAPKPS